ncbi:unnamed protein product, partial [Phaeothamnion confervicola]
KLPWARKSSAIRVVRLNAKDPGERILNKSFTPRLHFLHGIPCVRLQPVKTALQENDIFLSSRFPSRKMAPTCEHPDGCTKVPHYGHESTRASFCARHKA